MSHRYDVLIQWSADDRAFVAGVPELPGCMAHGSTRAKARENIKQAIALWLDTAREYGDPVPEPQRTSAPTG
ncbi:MAG: type II toxin-antitoxin system HicB family antitoxin [Gemmatimonadota bacterium]|nr:type II toxin-antitoxin system HicB family antitoxin [Gemmatimonadota bacterium]MDE2873217.1 type II toxin-antitoxin system HicB family antitoxin [Gemmatimonadota bacterium]